MHNKDRVIKVRGSANVTAVPDWVVIRFSIIGKDYEYTRCMKKLSTQTESLREELASVDIEKESLKTSHFSIDTDTEYRDGRYIFKGYNAQHDAKIEFPFDKDYLNKVLQALSKTASKTTFTVSFIVKDPEPMQQQAIADAVKNCQQKAVILAEAAGISLGEIINIDYSWAEVRFESRMEVCSSSKEAPDYFMDINPDDVGHSDSVTVYWEIV